MAADAPTLVRPGSGAMFDRIARRYDLANRILSFGLDRGWRRRAVAALELHGSSPARTDRPQRVLDLATGTADVALEIVRQAPSAAVVGLDPSAAMLAIGRRKVRDAGVEARVELRLGAAESLPYDDDTFDGAIIAWGIRNVADRRAGLAEMARVVRPGGRVVILEANEPRGGVLAPGARLYLRRVVPHLGAILSRAPSEYRYLQTSIEAFPQPDAFIEMMTGAGLELVRAELLTFGVTGLYVGTPKTTAGGAA